MIMKRNITDKSSLISGSSENCPCFNDVSFASFPSFEILLLFLSLSLSHLKRLLSSSLNVQQKMVKEREEMMETEKRISDSTRKRRTEGVSLFYFFHESQWIWRRLESTPMTVSSSNDRLRIIMTVIWLQKESWLRTDSLLFLLQKPSHASLSSFYLLSVQSLQKYLSTSYSCSRVFCVLDSDFWLWTGILFLSLSLLTKREKRSRRRTSPSSCKTNASARNSWSSFSLILIIISLLLSLFLIRVWIVFGFLFFLVHLFHFLFAIFLSLSLSFFLLLHFFVALLKSQLTPNFWKNSRRRILDL